MVAGLKFITSHKLTEDCLAQLAHKHGLHADIKRGILTLSDSSESASLKLTFYNEQDFDSLANFSEQDNASLYQKKLGKKHQTVIEVTVADGFDKQQLVKALADVFTKELGELVLEDADGKLIDKDVLA